MFSVRERAVDVGVAVAVFAASLGLMAAGDSDFGTASVAFAAVASLPLAVRRRAPLTVFVVVALGSTALRAVTGPAGPPIGPTLALYWMVAGSEESRDRTRLMAIVVVTMLAAHVTAGGLREDRFPGPELLFGVLLWGSAWLAADRTRLRQQRMAALEERALRAEREADRERRLAAAEERTRIARDLHDSAGHAINVILVHAGLGRLHSDDDDPRATREAFATIEDVARETVTEIDQMVRVLRENGSDAEVEPPPGVPALDALVERHRAAGLDVTTRVTGAVDRLPPGVDRTAYRVLQESLTNAARHGGGSAHVVVATGADALELTVVSPLAPGGAPQPPEGGGHGIVGMRERIVLLGGVLEAGAIDGRFRVHARIPLTEHGR
jgi:signal transduction histidine kinase